MHTIDAIFADGVFKPIGPIAIADNQRVRLTIEKAESVDAVAWMAELQEFQAQIIASHGILPDSTLDIAADRRRHEGS